jgi:Protein of Unknown function (DUF2784)
VNRFTLAADLVVAIHAGFVAFVIAGGFLCLRWRRLAWAHLPAFLWGAWVELSDTICPLTPLEQHFRTLAGQAGYGGGFIEHYLEPVLYPTGLTRGVQIGLGVAVLIGNAAIYLALWRRRRR